MKDSNGNELTPQEYKRLLRRSHPQFNWWKAKPMHRVGAGKPPPGVRQNREISKL